MSSAISVRNLGKCYRVDHAAPRVRYRTLRESLARAATAPLRRLRGETSGASEEFWALQDVSFDVQPGEVVGIIGRNGAGKSTLLKILSRITRPTVGEVSLVGRVGSLLEVGTGFHPELTGQENIYLNGSILGMSRREIRRRFDEIVEFAEIHRFLDTPVKRYSSGMYVRLAFAVAAHFEPEILVVDEVLAVGDADFQKKCMGKMKSIARAQRTVLFVSHNLAAIESLCSRACLIRSGRLVSEGSPAAVLGEYLSEGAQSENGIFDLSNHPARGARRHPVIRELVLRNAGGESRSSFYPNQPLHVELLLEPRTPVRHPRLAIAIEDSLGGRLMTAASYFGQDEIGLISGLVRVQCVIPSLRLGAGRYLLSASIATKDEGLIDSLDCAAWFDVVWRDSYGSGEPYLPVYGPVLCESSWDRLTSPECASETERVGSRHATVAAD